MDNLLIAIPARFNSTRLPGKPLLKINDKTIIHHVYSSIKEIKDCDNAKIIFLTDDKRVYDEVIQFGGDCYISEKYCENGTDRIIDYMLKNNIQKKYVLNIQGDEPFFDIDKIGDLIHDFIAKNNLNEKITCGTMYYSTNDYDYVNSNNKVKLVINEQNYIMYGSRQVIPGSKKNLNTIKDIQYHIHIGIFIFNCDYLIQSYNKKNGYYQTIEDLEWLKVIEQDFKIYALETDKHEIGVDTQEDYEYLKNKFEKI